MSEDKKSRKPGERDEARREFLKKAGQVAVTTPAVTLLLSAGTKNTAKAGLIVYATDGPQIDNPADGPVAEDDGIVDGVDADAKSQL